MSGELDIRGGGPIAVDTATLRTTAAGFDALAAELDDIAQELGRVQLMLFTEREGWEASTSAFALYRRLTAAHDETQGVGVRLRQAAALYETAELNAAHASAILAGDFDTAARLDRRRAELGELYPMAVWEAWGTQAEYNAMWPSELVRQGTEAWEPFGELPGVIGGGAAYALARTAGAVGLGIVGREARLSGDPVQVRVWRTGTTPVLPGATAPATLAAAADRIPSAGAGDVRIRVESYTMPGGSRQYAVYIAGTKETLAPSEPFSTASAVGLEFGQRTASYDAVLEALHDAGAKPGEVVHAIGHSQGGAIAGHLALEGGFDTRTLVTLGSPIEADVPDTTLSVALRHTDDPIAMLTAGGHDHVVGSAGSFIAHRVADPTAGLNDLTVPAHSAAAYVETARMLDASSDPRMEAVRHVLQELGEATSVVVTEYGAETE